MQSLLKYLTQSCIPLVRRKHSLLSFVKRVDYYGGDPKQESNKGAISLSIATSAQTPDTKAALNIENKKNFLFSAFLENSAGVKELQVPIRGATYPTVLSVDSVFYILNIYLCYLGGVLTLCVSYVYPKLPKPVRVRTSFSWPSYAARVYPSYLTTFHGA